MNPVRALPLIAVASALWIAGAPQCLAQTTVRAPKAIATEPADAGIDLLIQGEYAGHKLGAQVVAMGAGSYRVYLEQGGLPGEGWDVKPPVQLDGTVSDNVVRFRPNAGFSAQLEAGVLNVQTDKGDHIRLTKVLRGSKTMGAKPPKGAIVLFDGTPNTELVGAKIVELKQDAALNNAGYVDHVQKALQQGVTTRRKFQSFSLHLEFRESLNASGRGQGRGNSGIYLQNRYEIQILDSLGQRLTQTRAYGDVCGEIYTQTVQKVNMSYPPFSWQTMDIDFEAAQFDASGTKTKNAVVTVRHNGVLIFDHQEITAKTGHGQPEGAQPGPINLQEHGAPVYFRNFWVVDKTAK